MCIRDRIGKVLTPEQAEVEKKPEPKHSLTEKMKFLQEQDKKQPEQKSPQHKQKKPVSYTHLDVYKRQPLPMECYYRWLYP